MATMNGVADTAVASTGRNDVVGTVGTGPTMATPDNRAAHAMSPAHAASSTAAREAAKHATLGPSFTCASVRVPSAQAHIPHGALPAVGSVHSLP